MPKINPVFFYLPNIIDYIRIILVFAACFQMGRNYWSVLFLYGLSQILDAVDGHLARALGQCSALGSVLDMLIDRCSTLCLFIRLSTIYPSFCLAFQFLAFLDIMSHWAMVHATLLFNNETHKIYNKKQHPILYIYYSSKIVLFICCLGNELFFLFLFAAKFNSNYVVNLFGFRLNIFHIGSIISSPIVLFKQLASIFQLQYAMSLLAEYQPTSKLAKKQQ